MPFLEELADACRGRGSGLPRLRRIGGSRVDRRHRRRQLPSPRRARPPRLRPGRSPRSVVGRLDGGRAGDTVARTGPTCSSSSTPSGSTSKGRPSRRSSAVPSTSWPGTSTPIPIIRWPSSCGPWPKRRSNPGEIPFEIIRPMIQAQAATAKLGWNPYLHNPKLRGRLGRISAPALVVHGAPRRDRSTGPRRGLRRRHPVGPAGRPRRRRTHGDRRASRRNRPLGPQSPPRLSAGWRASSRLGRALRALVPFRAYGVRDRIRIPRDVAPGGASAACAPPQAPPRHAVIRRLDRRRRAAGKPGAAGAGGRRRAGERILRVRRHRRGRHPGRRQQCVRVPAVPSGSDPP